MRERASRFERRPRPVNEANKRQETQDHRFHELRVAAVVDETADTRSFVLDVPPELAPAFSYRAGQYCTFRATIDGEAVARCYSMSSAPEIGEPLTTTVKRVVDGRMSNWMNDTLRVGERIEVMPPVGLFVLSEPSARDAPIVAFAGGSGITPVFAIVKSALATTMRRILLVDANRDPSSVIFAAALDRLVAESGGRLVVHHHFDDASGFLDPTACATIVGDRTGADCADADCYVCGPGPFMDTVEAGLSEYGVPSAHVLTERFVVPGDDAAVDDAAVLTETVVIRLGRASHTFEYKSGDTVLETARRGGLSPPFSCESGSCATCMAHLDDGTVRMRVNNALAVDEVAEGWVLTCQSLPTSRTITINYDA